MNKEIIITWIKKILKINKKVEMLNLKTNTALYSMKIVQKNIGLKIVPNLINFDASRSF